MLDFHRTLVFRLKLLIWQLIAMRHALLCYSEQQHTGVRAQTLCNVCKCVRGHYAIFVSSITCQKITRHSLRTKSRTRRAQLPISLRSPPRLPHGPLPLQLFLLERLIAALLSIVNFGTIQSRHASAFSHWLINRQGPLLLPECGTRCYEAAAL